MVKWHRISKKEKKKQLRNLKDIEMHSNHSTIQDEPFFPQRYFHLQWSWNGKNAVDKVKTPPDAKKNNVTKKKYKWNAFPEY